MAETPAHEATKTYLCKTRGCTNEAKAANGRQAYCTPCQVRRGTARPDGTVIQGRIPSAPGSRSGRGQAAAQGPFEAKTMELIGAARELDFWLERYREAKPALEQAVRKWREVVEQFGTMTAPAVSGQAVGVADDPDQALVSEPSH